ncbi:hypothetical protein HispidOSU_021008 [Sigmodon hispidus]
MFKRALGGVHATAWPSANRRYPQRARINAGLFGPALAPLGTKRSTGPARISRRARAQAACAAESRPLPAADRLSRLGSKQTVTSPPTAAVRLNSGATPTPRRAERPDRLGRDRWQRADGHPRRNKRARGMRAARTTPQNGPEEKSPGARSHALPRGKTTPPHGFASNRCEREGQPRSHATETIKGAAGRAVLSFYAGMPRLLLYLQVSELANDQAKQDGAEFSWRFLLFGQTQKLEVSVPLRNYLGEMRICNGGLQNWSVGPGRLELGGRPS